MKVKFFSVIIVFLLLFSFTASVKAVEKVNLAVMNFYCENVTADKDWIGPGFSETLTERLSKLNNVNVLKRETQRPVIAEMGIDINQKFQPGMTQALGKTLGVDYLLNGLVKENNNQVSVTFQLWDVKTGAVVGEEVVSGNLDKIFDIQGDLALKVAKYFNSPVSEDEKQDLYFIPTQSISSFEKFSRGLNFYEENKIDEAYNFFLSSIKADTGFLDAHRYFQYTARQTGKLDDFINNYEAMLASDPGNPILMNYLGNAYLDKGKLAKAEGLYKKAIEIAPTFSNPYNNLATVYVYSKNFNTALENFEKSLKYADRKGPVLYNIGLCYLNMGNKEKAKEYFARALEEDPKNPDFIIARHYLYGAKVIVTSKEKAVPGKVLGEILLNSEPVFEIHSAAGGFSPARRAKIIAGRLSTMISEGLEPYQIEVGKINNQVVIQSSFGQLIMTITPEMAEREGTTVPLFAEHKMEVLKRILTSSTAVSYTEGGFVLQGDDEKDMECLTEEAKCLHRGDTFYCNGELDKASEEYKKAIEINPDFIPSYFCLGVISYDKKNYSEALEYFNKVIKKNPSYVDGYIWMGKTYMSAGKSLQAKNTFEKALELEPDNLEAKEYLEKL